MNSVNFFSSVALGSSDHQSPLRTRRSASASSIPSIHDRADHHSRQPRSREEGDTSDTSPSFASGRLPAAGHPSSDKLAAADARTRSGAAAADNHYYDDDDDAYDEKTPLIKANRAYHADSEAHASFVKRISGAIVGTVRLIITAVLAPGRYIIACFYDDDGKFSAAMPIYRISRKMFRRQTPSQRAGKLDAVAVPSSLVAGDDEKASSDANRKSPRRRPPRLTGEDRPVADPDRDTPSKHTRSHSVAESINSSGDETEGRKSTRSIRINVAQDEALRQRKQRRRVSGEDGSTAEGSRQPMLTVDTLKSPTSPTSASRLTRYPRLPAPPRPLVPKRQPSYTSMIPPAISSSSQQKTLIIDLDETLIHSMAKGGRMSTGHMVEVKLSTPVGAGGQVLGPQVPILYYVHKRPHCDEFLRKVSKWFNLVVFTASVQEYADPVIDWLELERKYFSARYYRQHCTFRNGAYIKDLSSVEPDLSKVMILDNSPMSYIFHNDNAIPIEGWISDPTDNDLLHLVPLLEGLQYVTDVRALLALRLGEASQPA